MLLFGPGTKARLNPGNWSISCLDGNVYSVTIDPDAQGSVCTRSEEHTSELQSLTNLVCRLLLASPTTESYTLSLHDALPILDRAKHLAFWTSILKNRKQACDAVVRTRYQGKTESG